MKLALWILVGLFVWGDVRAEESEEHEGESTAWARLTSWLRPRRNPFRTTVSDIVVRNRRSPFTMPEVLRLDVERPRQPGEMTENEARRYMAAKEREFVLLQEAFDREEDEKVVREGRKFIEDLEKHQVGPEHAIRRNELLRDARHRINQSREKIEDQGMKKLKEDYQQMQKAFRDENYDQLRVLERDISRFVNEWAFRNEINRRIAFKQQGLAQNLVKRAAIREEFKTLTLHVGFLVVTPKGSSTAVINGRTVREGERFDENLKIKKIAVNQITFDFKGELITKELD